MKLFRLVGSMGKLEKLGRDLGRDRALLFLRSLSAELGKESLLLVQEGFAQGIDPSGKPWPRPKSAHRALIDSGDLKKSFRVDSNEHRMKLYSTSPHAIFLQRGVRFHGGKRGMTPRKMIPETRLPLRWKVRLVPIFQRHIQKLMRGQL